MHIVVLTGSYYPYLMPPAACVKPYLDELAKNHFVEVIAPSTDCKYKTSFKCDGVTVRYIDSFPNKVLTLIEEGIKTHKAPLFYKLSKTIFRGMRFIKYTLGRVPYETSLITSYVKEAEKVHRGKTVDVIISVTFPYYTHVAALRFKKDYPSVRWVTYSTDPLAYSEANPIEKFKLTTAKLIEKEVYSSCDKCIVTEELLPNLIKDYGIPREKIVVLPYLLKDMPISATEIHSDKPVVLYAGYVFIRVRPPQKMLSVFSLLPNLELRLYISGDRHCRRILSKEYPKNIKKSGLVSREEYYKQLGSADVLILLSNDATLQAPSKLMELISTGKPIINFYYHQDAGFQLIEKYPLGLNVSNAEEDRIIANRISAFVKEVLHNQLDRNEIHQLFPERLLSTQMPMFIDAISH